MEHVNEISFPYWGFDREVISQRLVERFNVDPRVAVVAADTAVDEFWDRGQITFRIWGSDAVTWAAAYETTCPGYEALPWLRPADERHAHNSRFSGAEGHPLAPHQLASERLLTLCALLVPRDERPRLVRALLDHLQCEREDDNRPTITAVSLILTGVLPIAVHARVYRARDALMRMGRR
jgi:hypothetical protein